MNRYPIKKSSGAPGSGNSLYLHLLLKADIDKVANTLCIDYMEE